MEEIKTTGIVLGSKDYKEKDKLVTIFSLEYGKILASLKGCKMPTSKLKFAYQPFCFAEFFLHKKGDCFTIINCNLLESFYDLTINPNDYIYASLMLEIVGYYSSMEQEDYSKLFIDLLDSLKQICYDNSRADIVSAKFCLNMLSLIGYRLSFDICNRCKEKFISNVYLDIETGEFVCENCKSYGNLQISKMAYSYLKLLVNTGISRLNTLKLKEEVLKEIILLLCNNLQNKLGYEIKTKKYII